MPAYRAHLFFNRSVSLVVITITRQFSCQTICQKSATVEGRQPCVAMYTFPLGSLPTSPAAESSEFHLM